MAKRAPVTHSYDETNVHLYDIWEQILRQCPPATLTKTKIATKLLASLFLQYYHQYVCSAKGFLPPLPLLGKKWEPKYDALCYRVLRFGASIDTCQVDPLPYDPDYDTIYRGPGGILITKKQPLMTEWDPPINPSECICEYYDCSPQCCLNVETRLYCSNPPVLPSLAFEIKRGIIQPNGSVVSILSFDTPSDVLYHRLDSAPYPRMLNSTNVTFDLRISFVSSDKFDAYVPIHVKGITSVYLYIVHVGYAIGKWTILHEEHCVLQSSMRSCMWNEQVHWSRAVLWHIYQSTTHSPNCLHAHIVQDSDTAITTLPIISIPLPTPPDKQFVKRYLCKFDTIHVYVFAVWDPEDADKYGSYEAFSYDRYDYLLIAFDDRHTLPQPLFIRNIRTVVGQSKSNVLWRRNSDDMIMFAYVDDDTLRVYELNHSDEPVWISKVTALSPLD